MDLKILFEDNEKVEKFNFFIGALGYESRCTAVALRLIMSNQMVNGFYLPLRDDCSESYKKNQKFYNENSFQSLFDGNEYVADESITIKYIHAAIENKINLLSKEGEVNVAIDVSSLPRILTAMIVRSIFKCSIKIDTFSIFYSPAKFAPPKQGFGPVAVSQPIIEEYAGWSMYPDRPPVAIIGLGYEYDRALGVLDYLDVDIKRAVLMMPLSSDERYNAEVKKANKILLSQVDSNQIVEYNVSSPEDSLIRLNAIISGLVRSNRVIVVPFGPKVFCSLALLSSEILQNKDITIWTVSGGKYEKPVDRKPSDFMYNIDFKCINNKSISK